MGNYWRTITAGFMLAALSLLAGCGQIAGASLFVNEKGDAAYGSGVSLLPVPVRREYRLEDDAFAKTGDHLTVFVVHTSGNVRKIALGQTEVFIGEDLITSEPYTFQSSGEKTVRVCYGEQEARYSIIVRSANDNADIPGGNTSSGDGTSIEIEII